MVLQNISLPTYSPVQAEAVYQASINRRIGTNFRASQQVHQFEYMGRGLIWKQAARFAPPIHFYYALQDAGFLGSRKFFASKEAQIITEARKLVHVNEDGAVLLQDYFIMMVKKLH